MQQYVSLNFQELRDPPTGKGVEAGGVTAATWQWYTAVNAALQGQHSISPPLVVASSLTATTGGSVSTPASTPSEEPRSSQQSRKRHRDSQALQSIREGRRKGETSSGERGGERKGSSSQSRLLCLCLKNLLINSK